jgi:hypothetical protein
MIIVLSPVRLLKLAAQMREPTSCPVLFASFDKIDHAIGTGQKLFQLLQHLRTGFADRIGFLVLNFVVMSFANNRD